MCTIDRVYFQKTEKQKTVQCQGAKALHQEVSRERAPVEIKKNGTDSDKNSRYLHLFSARSCVKFVKHLDKPKQNRTCS